MKIFKSLLAIAVIFSLSLNAFSLDKNDKGDAINVGEKVSDFTITNYDGATYTLSNSGAKATVIIFMSTECPFVQPYTDRLIELNKQFSESGIVIWGINSNNTEPTDMVMTHAKEKGYTFPILKDNDNQVANMLGASRTPEVFVIDNNSMTLVYHGRIDDNKEADKVTSNDLQTALNEFIAGQPIATNQTKAFGCSIKKAN
ncbi:MAG TPA: thioredoxin family protein [Ignavibacteria bacterium]|nr:thioredoxin family protein [Ignavibacteria bacterium]